MYRYAKATAFPLAYLLVTPFNPRLLTLNKCLADNFYGTFGPAASAVFLPTSSCMGSLTTDVSEWASIVPVSDELQQLVWLEEKAVDLSIKSGAQSFENGLGTFFERLSRLPSDFDDASPYQEILSMPGNSPEIRLIYQSSSSAIVSVPYETAMTIDTILPRFWKSTVLPKTPVPFIPVPSPAIEHVKHLLASLKYNPEVDSIVNNISVPQMKNDIEYLTGEDGKSGIVSRHSFADGSRTAAAWLKDRFEDTGATCELKRFMQGFAPNVICRYPSTVNTNGTVLLSAHYDSRGSFGSVRAPGGDDDGSGTIAILAIARTIARKGLTFRSNVELVAFAGEEQGLFGSRAYSRELRAMNANLTVMIQADMLAYHVDGEPPQLGLPDLIGTPEVTQLVANISATYSPELVVGFTPACCSDHQSFHQQGFPATQVFERAGPIADPMYHNSGDLSNRKGYDLEQVKSIAKVQFATLLHAAGYDLPE